MDFWRILGIEPTDDIDAIQQAYREKLKVTNPEDDPQGFMKLREALEKAVNEAKYQQQEIEEYYEDDDASEEIRIKMEELEKNLQIIYSSFSRRISEGEWNNLLNSVVFTDNQYKSFAIFELMVFIAENSNIPYRIRSLIKDKLGLNKDMSLWNRFSEDFVGYMLDEIKWQEYPPYEYIYGTDDLPFDEYIELSFKLKDEIISEKLEDAEETLEQMESMGIENPMLNIEKASLCIKKQDFDSAQMYIDELMDEYEDNVNVLTLQGDIYYLTEEYGRAYQFFKYASEAVPEALYPAFSMTLALIGMENYKEAEGLLSKLHEKHPHNHEIINAIEVCRENYFQQLGEQIRGGDASSEIQYEYMRQLVYAGRYDEALLLLEKIGEECASYEGFHKYAAYIFYNTGNEAKCLEHIDKANDPALGHLESILYYNRGEKFKAIEIIDRMIDAEPENVNAYTQKGHMLNDMYDFKECIETMNQLLDIDPINHEAYVIRAQAYYELGFYNEVFRDCQTAVEFDKYDITAYSLMIKVLSESGEIDEAKKVLNLLKKEGAKGTEIMFLEAFIKEGLDEYDAAEEIYNKIIEIEEARKPGDETNELCKNDLAEVFYRIISMYYNEEYDKDDYDYGAYEYVTTLIDEGLKKDGNIVPILELKGDFERTFENYDKAEEAYNKILKLAPGHENIHRVMADLADDKFDWNEAIKHINIVLKNSNRIEDYRTKAMYLIRKGEFKEAMDTIAIAFSMKPEYPEGLYIMGLIMEYKGDDDSALQYYLEAISLGEEKDEICERAYEGAAAIYRRRKGFVQAEEMISKVMELTDEIEYLCKIRDICIDGGNIKGAKAAIKQFREAGKLGRMSFRYTWEMAPVYVAAGKIDEAYDMYDMISVEDAKARLEAGKILFYKGKCKKALKLFQKAIKMLDEERMVEEDTYSTAIYYLWAARACLALGNSRDASVYAAEGLRYIDEKYKEMFFNWLPKLESIVGALYAVKGNYEAAEEILKNALEERKCEHCPHSCCYEALYQLSYLYSIQGRVEEAMACLERAAETAPADLDVYCALMNMRGKRL